MQPNLSDPGLWLAGSLVAAVLFTNITWLVLRWPAAARLASRDGLKPLHWLIVSLFLLLPPMLAWRYGALSLSFMGIAELDWVGTILSGGLPAVMVAGLLLFGWSAYRRHVGFSWEQEGSARNLAPAWRAFLDAALLQWHWAFYRASAIAWLIGLPPDAALARGVLSLGGAWQNDPLYWGSWLGMTAAAMEWVLNPFARRALRRPGLSELAILRAVVAIATTALFVITRNFWLSLACHCVVEVVIARSRSSAPAN